ncbi:hypothetical protein Tco_0260435 [Tanacetum coccineum]
MTHNPTIANETIELRATIDNTEYTITEASIRSKLQLEDASGISMFPNTEVFEGMGNMGYPTDGTFTFWKSHFTPQWRFLIHHVLHCLSPKSGGWDQFGSNIATVLICLSTGRIYNFSKLIFDGMVANLKSKTKFLMYPRFLQMILEINPETKKFYLSIAFTKKIFGNMKRGFGGILKPLLPAMLSVANPIAGQEGPSNISPPSISTPEVQPVPTPIPAPDPTPIPVPERTPVSTPEPTPVPIHEPTHIPESISIPTTSPEVEPIEHTYEQHLPTLPHEPAAQTLRMEELLLLVPTLLTKVDALKTELKQSKEIMGKAIIKLVKKVKKLEVALKKRRVVLSYSKDQDEEIAKDKFDGYETPKKGTYIGDMDIIPQGLEAAEILAETLKEVNTASEVPLVSIVDVTLGTPSRTVMYSRRSAEKRPVKDKGKAIMTEPEPEKKSKKQLEEERLSLAEAYRLQKQMDDEQRAQIARDKEIARQWEAEEQQRAIDEEQSAKIDWNDPTVIMYHAKLMKPKTVAQARRNMIKYLKNQGNYKIKDFKGMSYDEIRPIFEKEEEVVEKMPRVKRKKSILRKSTKGSNKKQKLEEDAEREGLKAYLDVVPREDVAIDVESLSTKYPIMDWQTYIVSKKFMYYQVFRGDGSSKNYTILSAMLEDFDRQDVEDLYSIVKNRFASSQPEGYDLLLWGDFHTLFEPNADDEIWEHQHNYENGIAIHMLTEKSYPLSQAMLTKMLSRRLEVDHESTQAFELLRLWLDSYWSTMELKRYHLVEVHSTNTTNGAKRLASPEQTATGKDTSNPLMVLMVYQKSYSFQLTMIHVLRVEMVLSPPWICTLLVAKGLTTPELMANW